MTRLAPYRLGRVLLHLITMCRNGEFAYHLRGAGRELWRA